MSTVHEGLKEHKCHLCGTGFGQAANLRSHIIYVHEGVKNHECNHCQKRFSEAYLLTKHVRAVHEGIKDYKCETCGNLFGHLCHLNLGNLDDGSLDYAST